LPRQSESTHWGYAGIGFGGGTWAYESVNKQPDVANYTEFSIVLGLESERMKRTAWKSEIGYVFGRSMKFENHTMRKFRIGDSIVFRVTLSI
jgi:opacity protein-like surface antigen